MKNKPSNNERLEPSPENVQSLAQKLTKAHNTWDKSKTYENAVEVQRTNRVRNGMIAELRSMIERVK